MEMIVTTFGKNYFCQVLPGNDMTMCIMPIMCSPSISEQVEVGLYVGYSSTRMASQMRHWGGKVISMDSQLQIAAGGS